MIFLNYHFYGYNIYNVKEGGILMKIKILLTLCILMLSGCSIAPSQPLRISSNLWIGYSPLFYIQQKGWLEDNNIKLINVVSLSESMEMYSSGFVDAFTGTQYELKQMQNQNPNLHTKILMDRSYGGDVVMGNRDIEALKKADKINVYLEVDSINSVLLESFIAMNGIERSVLKLIDKDPDASSMLSMKNEPTLIITYTPYDIGLHKSGYEVLDTTKNMQLFIMDALYIDDTIAKKYEDELIVLNRLIGRALNDLKKNPKEYYAAIYPFFKYEDDKAFSKALDSVQWIYEDRTSALLKQLKSQEIVVDKLMEPAK